MLILRNVQTCGEQVTTYVSEVWAQSENSVLVFGPGTAKFCDIWLSVFRINRPRAGLPGMMYHI